MEVHMPTTKKAEQEGIIAKIIEWSVNNQLLVMVMMLIIAIGGFLSLQKTPLDAIPDLTDTQVIIRTEFSGQSPAIVEDLVTYPLSTTMLSLPHTKDVRGFSMFGTSFVYIIFEDNVDQYWARSRVLEALTQIQGQLPATAKPQMGPDATGAGWVYQYALIDKTGKHDLAELRALQDWFLKFELATVDGVSEVSSVGGFTKEYQILADPNKLRAYGITLARIQQAVKGASKEVGGRLIEQAETEFIIRSKGYVQSIEDIENINIFAENGTPVQLKDVARVQQGPELRRGVTELNGEGEVVSGIVIMRSGENALNVIEGVKAKIDTLRNGLPEGVEIVTVYDRAPLIQDAVSYLTSTLIKEMFVVALVILVFLLHVRSVFVAIITLPLGILAAFIIMAEQGITANIVSLGGIAIAIGTMVDAAIVMVENAHRKLSALPESASASEKKEAIVTAAKEVGPGLFFSLLIITISFLPVLALEGQSYKLFSPLAFTKTYVLAFSAVLAITVIPVLMVWMLKGRIKKTEESAVNRAIIRHYTPLLMLALKHKTVTIGISIVVLISTAWPVLKTGTEFMPALYEGELLYMPTTLPGVSITKAREILQLTDRLIKEIPEVERVFGKAGRADTATDPAPISMIETWVKLKPKDQWRDGLTIKQLTRELDQQVKIPGLVNSWGYPIKIRMDMVTTGIRTPVGIKITGDNLATINRIAAEVETAVKQVEGTRSAFAERVIGGKYLDIEPNRDALARHNIDLHMFQQVVQTALGGMKLGESVQGRERYNIMLRYDRQFRESADDLKNILVPAPAGKFPTGMAPRKHIPLGELATITYTEGPPMIKSENARLTGWVFVDIDGLDIGSFVKNAQKIVSENVDLPAGYALIWSGQFEQLQKANKQLSIAIPAAIIAIFVLLMLYFGRLDRTLMVMLSIPFALVGGYWAVYLAGYNNSVATGVGFIALAGLAVETATIMLIYIDLQMKENSPKTLGEFSQTIIEGATMRIRPVLMTAITEFAGLLPIFLAFGIGSDVMRRIALPMVGGMVTTIILTLILVPVIYYLWEGRNITPQKGEK
jgi:Cu(I)/Ag(I) efflux system membrane protein CusA/SilA